LAFPEEFHHEGANYETGAHPHLSTSAEVLNREQVLTIHTAALQILEKTGFKMEHLGTLEILADAGSKVSNGDWVRLSAYLVEEALSRSPFMTRGATKRCSSPTATISMARAQMPLLVWICGTQS
jgi:trimethylamine:corrinoid methyltransferase-like protein